jgi:hypothetical protein
MGRQTEYLTLASAIDDLADSGFVEHFGVSDGALRSFDSGRRFSAAELVIREYHRFEGVSDPDDMSIVYGIAGRPRVFDRPGEILERSPVREPSVFGRYNYGFPVPVPKDPWHDEGGESGPTP